MKSVTVQLPDKVYELAEAAIREGYFTDLDDLVRLSIMNFVHRPQLDQIEAQQLEDLQKLREAQPMEV